MISAYSRQFNFEMFYVRFMVGTKQKPIVDTQKIKRRESIHSTMNNHQVTKDDSKKEKKAKELQNNQKTIMAIVSPYLSIITLNVSRLNYPIKRHTVEWIKTQLYVA